MKLKYRLLLISFIFSFLCSVLFAQMFGQEPVERERTYDVEHIKIEVSLDLENKLLEGRVTTSIRSLAGRLDSFKVDAVGMNIKSVKGWYHVHTDNPEIAEQFGNIAYSYDGSEITIKPGAPIAKNFPYKYQVEYSTTDPEKGLYFIKPDSLFPDKPYQVWTIEHRPCMCFVHKVRRGPRVQTWKNKIQ